MAEKQAKTVSKAKKIYNIVSTVLVALLFIFLVVVVGLMLWQRKSGDSKGFFGYHMYNVITESMQGTIDKGDVIICKEVDVNALKVGDIITFTAPSGQLKGQTVTHRIVEVHLKDDDTVDYFITKGDNDEVAPTADDWQLSPSLVKAKYVKTSKFLAGFSNFVTKWYGYVLLIVMPLLIAGTLLIIGYVKDRVKIEKEKMSGDGVVTLDSLSDEEKQKLLDSLDISEKNAETPQPENTADIDENVHAAQTDSDEK